MRVAFQTNQLSIRGTEVAVYDYAHFNEEILNNESYVVVKKKHMWPHSNLVINKFRDRFGDRLYFYDSQADMESFLNKNNIDVFYSLKAGMKDDAISSGRKSCIHCVFQYYDPHGDVYAYIANWISKRMNNGESPVVPHILHLPDVDDDMRERLNIPKDAVVLGRHGGNDTFNLPWTKKAIKTVLEKRKDIYFLFLNTNKFQNHERIIHLNGMSDLVEKTKFINTCDAMIHARMNGECFPLSLGEFSIRNKPIITWTGKDVEKYYKHPYDLGTPELLKDKGIYYDGYEDLLEILENFQPQPDKDWNAYKEYTPEKVMAIFKKVFLD